MPFVITIYEDLAGAPGDEVCAHAVDLTGALAGESLGRDLFRYEAWLDSCCDLSNGWISIVGGGAPLCWFMWRSSPTGDNSNCVDDGGGIRCDSGEHYNDLSVCLAGEPETIPTASEWGLGAMALLVLSCGTILLMRRRRCWGHL